MNSMRTTMVALVLLGWGCTSTQIPIAEDDAPSDSGADVLDAGMNDAGSGDAGSLDGGTSDAGTDTGSPDAGTVVCDYRGVSCLGIRPTCGEGEIPSVVDSCWGECVSLEACATVACGPRPLCGAEPTCGAGLRAVLLSETACWGGCVAEARCAL